MLGEKLIISLCLVLTSTTWAARLSLTDGRDSEAAKEEKRVSFDLGNEEPPTKASRAPKGKTPPKLTKRDKSTTFSFPSESPLTASKEQKEDAEIKDDKSSGEMATKSSKKSWYQSSKWNISKTFSRTSQEKGRTRVEEKPMGSSNVAFVAHSHAPMDSSFTFVSDLAKVRSIIAAERVVGILFVLPSSDDLQHHHALEEFRERLSRASQQVVLLEVKADPSDTSSFETIARACDVASLPTFLIFKHGTLLYRRCHLEPGLIIELLQEM